MVTRHLYVIPYGAIAKWERLGWNVSAVQPGTVGGIQIENSARWPLYPCNSCSEAISELRHTAFRGACSDCWDDADAAEILH